MNAFGHRAAYLTATALRKRDIERRTWNSLLIDIYRCSCVPFFHSSSSPSPSLARYGIDAYQSFLLDGYSVAHSQFVLVLNFANAIRYDEELKAQPALHDMMRTCFELFGTFPFPVSSLPSLLFDSVLTLFR